MKVCIIGSGRAGAEAAREAARCGAEVTLVDSDESPVPDWRSWPDLISKAGRGSAPVPRPLPPEAERLCGTRVRYLGRGEAMLAGGGRLRADAFVLALGPSFGTLSIDGRSKPGFTTMDSPGTYGRFGLALASSERVAVAGEASRGLQVAERATAGGRQVTVFASSWQHGAPGLLAGSVLSDAARERGVSLVHGRVDRALGARKLEAVLVAGKVVPADALAVVPRRVPGRIPNPAAPGKHGGLSVMLDMRTGCPDILAAGGCAEVEEGNPPSATLEDEEGPSGRIAGASATGLDVRLPVFRRWSCSVFGLTWSCVGIGGAAARAAGLYVDEVGERRDGRSSCALVYDRRSGAVLGVETVGAPAEGEAPVPHLDRQVTLRTLAYGDALGSSDITAVSDTARLALETWSKS